MNNYKLISYLIYLPITFYITVIVGRVLYKRGLPFLLDMFSNNEILANILNKSLLLGYYLINLGFAAVSINTFYSIASSTQLVEELSKRIGLNIISIAIIHYFNLFTFSHFSKQIQHLYKNNQ